MFSNIVAIIGPRFGDATSGVKKYTPEISLGLGLAAGVAGVIMLAKAHRKADEVYAPIAEDLQQAELYLEEHAEEEGAPNPVEKVQYMSPIYTKAAVETVKLYGPGLLVGVAGVALVLTSHGLMKGRIRSLMAVATLLERGFATYRSRVVEDQGVETDERYMYGAEQRTVVTIEQNENGKKKKRKSRENYLPEEYSPAMYERVFDNMNPNYDPDPSMNLFFLQVVERHMNDMLNLKGWLTLNKVYESLHMAESAEGAVVGWSRNMPGDDYVDFGLNSDINKRDGGNSWLLDFNVNGVMYQLINA